MSLIDELQRRKVFKVGAAALVEKVGLSR